MEEERPASSISEDNPSQTLVDEQDTGVTDSMASATTQPTSEPSQNSVNTIIPAVASSTDDPLPSMGADDQSTGSATATADDSIPVHNLSETPRQSELETTDSILDSWTSVPDDARDDLTDQLIQPPPGTTTESLDPASESAPPPSFEFADNTQTIDWMNAGSPLESATQEPVTEVGLVSTEPLLDHPTGPADSTHPASDPSQQDLPDGFESIDAHPVDISSQSPPHDAPSQPFGLQDDTQEPPSSMPWDLAADGDHSEAPPASKLPWEDSNNSQNLDAVDLWSQELAPSNDSVNLEDSWAKAFADPDSGLDDSWNAAFAAGFDDDGLLEDEPTIAPPPPIATSYAPSNQQSALPAASAPFPPRRTSSTNAPTSPYAATPPVPANVHQQSASSGPMQFFAELPTQPVRSKKPRPQAPPQSQSSAPPPPPSRNQAPSMETAPPVPPGQGFARFQQPERMEMFPAQPSVPVASPQVSAPGSSEPPPLQKSQSAARYSPAPQAPAVPSTERPSLSGTSRYTSAPTQSSQSPPTQTAQPYPQPTAASKYSYAPSNAAQPPRQSSYARPPSSSGPPAPSPPQAGPPPAAPGSSTTAPRAPPPAGPPPNPFAPRTSSPLAHSGFRSIDDQSNSTSYPTQIPSAAVRYSPGPTAQQAQLVSASSPVMGESVPSTTSAHAGQAPTNNFAPIASPHQAQASSPRSFHGAATEHPRALDPRPVPASASSSSINVSSQIHSQPVGEMDFLLPTDETSQDSLERWKGSAIFHWGPGGLAVSSLPKHIPRYGGGQSAPKIKPISGEVKIQRTKDLFSSSDGLPPFPGPLKSKAKKKDVVLWLSSAVTLFEQQLQASVLEPVPSLQLEEKIILWKVIRILVENDGVLTNNPASEAAARDILVQGIKSTETTSLDGIGNLSTAQSPGTPNPSEIETIKRLVLEGNREKAVWHAVDHQLWAHALLLSSTALPDVWKQVVQEFVRKEVRSIGPNLQSMAALYQVIAGNWDDSIDELVPLSARSGFQMISTATSTTQSRDAFQGLNKWRETLSLMLSNGSPDDGKAIIALGKLLAGSGRIEAAHVCFVFARGNSLFGGADDPNTNFSLLGVDHANLWSGGAVDLQAIQLTEAYEFGLTLNSANTAYYAPHLQAYKLQHALSLADSGSRSDALQYCETIAAAMKSTTRLSPYCHATLASQLDDLQRRLSQSPKDGSSSWISKPTMSKMSSSMGTWFNSFVAGDEAETASNGSGPHSEQEIGPFAHITGNTPIVSRSTSIADLHGAANYAPPGAQPPSKYAPSYQATQRAGMGDEVGTHGAPSPYSASPELTRTSYSPRQSNDGFSHSYGSPPKSANFTRYSSQLSQPHSYSPQGRPDSSSSRPSYEPYVPAVPEEPTSTYQPTGDLGYPMPAEQTPAETTPSVSYQPNGTPATNGFGLTSNVPESAPGLGIGTPSVYSPPQGQETFQRSEGSDNPEGSQSSYEPLNGGYEPPSGGYAPLSDSYAPSSYQPYEPNIQEEDKTSETKNKSLMDDEDDDFAARAAEIKRQERAAADKATDDAFKAAAEADAARDKAGGDKRASSGWFSGIGGFFGGSAKKEANAPQVYRAKLGEENSFYFDKELNKWVNRKGGSSSPGTASGTATPPPPPKASAPPPSRNVSTAAGPPSTSATSGSDGALRPPPSSIPMRDASASGPPSRTGTPGSVADSTASGTLQPESGSAGAAIGASSGAGPPSQGGPPSGPPSRPPTSMSDANSIDDLIGGPQARKGGTIKKGKKGQRYVDVMAK